MHFGNTVTPLPFHLSTHSTYGVHMLELDDEYGPILTDKDKLPAFICLQIKPNVDLIQLSN